MAVTLIAVAGLVVDGGAMYVERRALQNGADAAALAVAQECGNENCGDEWDIADHYVGLNAGGARADLVCGNDPAGGLTACTEAAPPGAAGASGWVRVRSLDDVEFRLMPGSRTLTADAVAAWGPLGGGVTLPLTFSECEYQFLGGTLGGPVPDGTAYIYFHDASQASLPETVCDTWAGHMDVPGGFGWLASDAPCQASFTAGGIAKIDTGKSQNDCRSVFADALGTTVMIPVFDVVQGVGNNTTYHIAGFAGFELLGYRITGSMRSPGFSCPAGPGQSAACIYGRFTPIVGSGPGFGGIDYGARATRIVG